MEKVEKVFTRVLEDEAKLDYPDFDAMWKRIEEKLPGQVDKLNSADQVISGFSRLRQKRFRKVAVLTALATVLVAAPVVATISYNWERILTYRSGVQSALEQGLGQMIGKSVTHEGVTFTIDTAVVDDNRTVLLYRISMKDGMTGKVSFSKMELMDSAGRVIEGRQFVSSVKENNMWSGYFETDWTPDELAADVKFTVRNLRSLASVERDIAFNPFDSQTQVFDIQQDGIGKLTIKPITQGEKVVLSTTTAFNQPEVKGWAHPRIDVSTGGVNVKTDGSSKLGMPGEQGEYKGQQSYRINDLQADSVKYKLTYTREEQRIDQEWAFDLQLNKQQMLSGTVKRDLDILLEHGDGRMVLKQMIITPTQIRVEASNKAGAVFPFLDYALEVNGRVLPGVRYFRNDNNSGNTTFRFELPSGFRVTEQMPVTFIAMHERARHRDENNPIRLTGISEEKQTMVTEVGVFPVTWTYYKEEGNLYVQSESTDTHFSGVTQTNIPDGESRLLGNPMILSSKDSNKRTDKYENFTRTEADLNIFWYYTQDPDKEMRVELTK